MNAFKIKITHFYTQTLLRIKKNYQLFPFLIYLLTLYFLIYIYIQSMLKGSLFNQATVSLKMGQLETLHNPLCVYVYMQNQETINLRRWSQYVTLVLSIWKPCNRLTHVLWVKLGRWTIQKLSMFVLAWSHKSVGSRFWVYWLGSNCWSGLKMCSLQETVTIVCSEMS